MDTLFFSFASRDLDDRFAAGPGETVFVAASSQAVLERYLGVLKEANSAGSFLLPTSPPVGELARPGEIDATTAEIFTARVQLARWNAAALDAALVVACPRLRTPVALAGWAPSDATAVFVSETGRDEEASIAAQAWRGCRGFSRRVTVPIDSGYARRRHLHRVCGIRVEGVG